MKSRLLFCLCLIVLGAGDPRLDPVDGNGKNKLPENVQKMFEGAKEWELISLDPNTQDKEGFHGYKILGSTTIQGDATKDVMKVLVKGIDDNQEAIAKCFIPRHGIRAKHDGKTVDLVICFECLHLHIYVDGKKGDNHVLIARAPQATLDKILTDAKVPLPPKKEK